MAGNPELLPGEDPVRVCYAVGVGELPRAPTCPLADLVEGVARLDGIPITASRGWGGGGPALTQSVQPERMKLGFAMPFRLARYEAVVPYLAAILFRVSPGLTTYHVEQPGPLAVCSVSADADIGPMRRSSNTTIDTTGASRWNVPMFPSSQEKELSLKKRKLYLSRRCTQTKDTPDFSKVQIVRPHQGSLAEIADSQRPRRSPLRRSPLSSAGHDRHVTVVAFWSGSRKTRSKSIALVSRITSSRSSSISSR